MATIRTGVIGSAGRMGKALLSYCETTADIEIVATLEVGDSIEQFLAAKPDVVVDLSLGSAVATNGPEVVTAGIPYIVGATGISDDVVSRLDGLSREHSTPVLIVPNFSLGANLMIRFARTAAKLMEAPVITERHHDKKLDAPSGTAMFTAGRIAESRPVSGGGSINVKEDVDGVLGGMVSGVPVHSVRGSGYLAEQDVMFSLPGETLTIEHRSIDRACFMPGIAFAIRNVSRVSGLATGLDTILD